VIPAASAGPQEWADWLELEALHSDDGNASISDLLRVIRRSGSVDGIAAAFSPGQIDRQGERSEQLADDAFSEIEGRLASCPDAYPFTVENNYIELTAEVTRSSYIFMLLLAEHGHLGGPTSIRGDRVFEEMCFEATRTGFLPPMMTGGSYLFAAPRPAAWKRGFSDAVDSLARALGEGEQARQRNRMRHAKDDGLDVVAWHAFPDGRPGKVILFGQCATGRNWNEKLRDLRPHEWMEEWFTDVPPVKPVGLFFVPFRLAQDDWASYSRKAGVIMDRCRIAHCLPQPPKSLAKRVERWIAHHFPALDQSVS
jgi:hypothetical protein